jgi:pyruvate/2-oxoglutarate dehydrogenase complex dihydrolipoamide acyltransferase (E2) component
LRLRGYAHHSASILLLGKNMRTPVLLPEIGTDDEELRVSCWLVDLGDAVVAGDRIVEILFDGVTFDVTAEHSGRVTRIERSLDAVVRAGDTLGWIETDEEPA